MTRYVQIGRGGELEKLGAAEVGEFAPNPPQGPTTLVSYSAMIVGVVVAVLSLFDVVPTSEDVQALGVIVGAVLTVVPYVVLAISRTKQANNLAKLAQGERLAQRGAVPIVVAPEGATEADVRKIAEGTGATVVPAGTSIEGRRSQVVLRLNGREIARTEPVRVDGDDRVVAADGPEVLGQPLDLSREVPGGGPHPAGAGAVASIAEDAEAREAAAETQARRDDIMGGERP